MYKKLYFIGIGGIGMSALARYFNKRGVLIYGYDKTETDLTKQLVQEGMFIHYQDQPDCIPENIDLVIITPAVPQDLKEYQYVLDKKIQILKRSQVLGLITAGNQNIAVAGTHGKTTTSCLLAHLIKVSGIPMTAFLGGIAVNYNSNYIDSGDEWLIEEADEYDRSFLYLQPDKAIIGSLDADHLDIYGNQEAMYDAYLEFALKIKPNGTLLLSDTIPKEIQKRFHDALHVIKIRTYGFENEMIQIKWHGTESDWMMFDYISETFNMKDLRMRMPGKHNLRNAAAAIAVAAELGVDQECIRLGLESFTGIKRRFEWIINTPDLVLIDDYAHHPEELRAVIEACRTIYPNRYITGIFQPHLYSRTRDFLNEFAAELSGLDRLILVELYPARETEISGINSFAIFNRVSLEDKYLTTKKELPELLKTLDLDVVMTLGAGDLDQMQNEIINVILKQEPIINTL